MGEGRDEKLYSELYIFWQNTDSLFTAVHP